MLALAAMALCPPLAACAAELSSITLRDVHPLYGGQIVYLSADGGGYCQLLTRRPGVAQLQERRYRLAPSPRRMQQLRQLLAARSFATLGDDSQPGLPDTPRPLLSVRYASGLTVSARRWLYDANPDFDALYRALLAVAQGAPAEPLIREGRFEMDWIPPGFEENKKN